MILRRLLPCLASLALLAQGAEKVDPTTGKKAGPPRVRGPLELKLGPAQTLSLEGEKVQAPPTRFQAALGAWRVVEDGGRKVLLVDGRAWKQKQPTGDLASKARSLYGGKQEAFIEGVQAFAYYPYALAQGLPEFREGELSVKFKVLGGELDQCAGLVFNVKPNGDYLALRFNGREDNLVLWTMYEGKRTFVTRAPDELSLAPNAWHELKLRVKGNRLEGWVDGQRLLDYPMPFTVNGKVGVWSKTDSLVVFDAFTLRPVQE
jgi:hypothetical protein